MKRPLTPAEQRLDDELLTKLNASPEEVMYANAFASPCFGLADCICLLRSVSQVLTSNRRDLRESLELHSSLIQIAIELEQSMDVETTVELSTYKNIETNKDSN